jgi:hypothetical protein
MRAGISDELRGSIEAHRLAVEQRAGESGGVVAFHPARHIGQPAKGLCVAFREAIFAEALDLRKAALSEIKHIAVLDHALDKLALMGLDLAVLTEAGHVAAQAVGLSGAVARADDGDAHRLLLKQRHALGAFEQLF